MKTINELLDEAGQTVICRNAWTYKRDAPSDAVFNPISGWWEESGDSIRKRLKDEIAKKQEDNHEPS